MFLLGVFWVAELFDPTREIAQALAARRPPNQWGHRRGADPEVCPPTPRDRDRKQDISLAEFAHKPCRLALGTNPQGWGVAKVARIECGVVSFAWAFRPGEFA